MRSKSFETQEVRDKSERRKRVERLSHLVDGNNNKCLPDGRKGMLRPGKIKKMQRKSMKERGRCFSMV